MYTALRSARPDGRTIAITNFAFDRDAYHFTLNGTLHLLAQVNGKSFGAVFLGQGSYTLTPATAIELDTIRSNTGDDKLTALTETFNTPELLAELGLTYLLDWCSDDQPFPLNVKAGRMISVPYSIEMNDVSLFVGKSSSPTDFAQMVMDQFDMLYEEGAQSGRAMCLALHPFIVNQPFRHKYLDRALEYIASHDKVWLTTSDEIADWYLTNAYDAARTATLTSTVRQ